MIKLMIVPALLGALVLGLGGVAQANLLLNGDLELPFFPGPPPGADPNGDVSPTFWTLSEGPDSTEDGNPPATCPAPGTCPTNTFQVDRNFENPALAGGVQGLALRAFMGNLDGANNERPETVFGHMTQSVAHVPGLNEYTLTGWFAFGPNYAGGRDFLVDGTTPSPTETFLALEFLDAGNNVLPGSVVRELHDDLGVVNGGGWNQETLVGIAPIGTANVQVRVSMVDGTAFFQGGGGGQAAAADDFSLTRRVPEPTSVALGLIGVLGLVGLMRRR